MSAARREGDAPAPSSDPTDGEEAAREEASRRQVEGTPAEGVLDPDAEDPVEPGEPG